MDQFLTRLFACSIKDTSPQDIQVSLGRINVLLDTTDTVEYGLVIALITPQLCVLLTEISNHAYCHDPRVKTKMMERCVDSILILLDKINRPFDKSSVKTKGDKCGGTGVCRRVNDRDQVYKSMVAKYSHTTLEGCLCSNTLSRRQMASIRTYQLGSRVGLDSAKHTMSRSFGK
jgi:hypothetical protein